MTNKKTGNNGCRGLAGPGRPKGSQNKVSGLLKEAILIAAENAGNEIGDNGLVSYLQQQAVQHPSAFMSGRRSGLSARSDETHVLHQNFWGRARQLVIPVWW